MSLGSMQQATRVTFRDGPWAIGCGARVERLHVLVRSLIDFTYLTRGIYYFQTDTDLSKVVDDLTFVPWN